jgi:hypothetical protein
MDAIAAGVLGVCIIIAAVMRAAAPQVGGRALPIRPPRRGELLRARHQDGPVVAAPEPVLRRTDGMVREQGAVGRAAGEMVFLTRNAEPTTQADRGRHPDFPGFNALAGPRLLSTVVRRCGRPREACSSTNCSTTRLGRELSCLTKRMGAAIPTSARCVGQLRLRQVIFFHEAGCGGCVVFRAFGRTASARVSGLASSPNGASNDAPRAALY